MNRGWVILVAVAWCGGCDPGPAGQTASSGQVPAPAAASKPAVSSAPAMATSAPSTNPGSGVLYREDFEKTEPGGVPEEFLVIDGAFAVRDLDGNRVLELPGEPLETFGVLFGPNLTEPAAVRARFNGTRRGRRFPTFGVGLGGAEGYRLIVSANKDALELFSGEKPVAGVEYKWESGNWTEMLLRIRRSGEGQWRIEGKVWRQGAPEPADWMIGLDSREPPPAGRASLWGSPFAGTPIQFDDLALMRVEPP